MNGEVESQTRPSTWSFAAATLLVLGGVSTAAQAAAAIYMDTVEQFDWRLSTGGAVALIAAAYMKLRCASWDEWKRRIWPWIAATAALAALSVYAASQGLGMTPARGPSGGPSGDASSDTSSEAQAASEDPSPEEIQTAVLRAMTVLDKAAYVDVIRDARAAGRSFAFIREKLAEDFEAGNMPAEQYCLMDYWVIEVKRNIRYRDESLASFCSTEILATSYGAPLRMARMPSS